MGRVSSKVINSGVCGAHSDGSLCDGQRGLRVHDKGLRALAGLWSPCVEMGCLMGHMNSITCTLFSLLCAGRWCPTPYPVYPYRVAASAHCLPAE